MMLTIYVATIVAAISYGMTSPVNEIHTHTTALVSNSKTKAKRNKKTTRPIAIKAMTDSKDRTDLTISILLIRALFLL